MGRWGNIGVEKCRVDICQVISYWSWVIQSSLNMASQTMKYIYSSIHLLVKCNVSYFFADIRNVTSLDDNVGPMPTEWTLTHEQQDRLSRKRAVCREMSQNSHVQLERLQHIWVDLRNKMLVCAPPNVGSNTLKYILLFTAGYPLNIQNTSKHIDKSLLLKYGITSLDTYRPVQAKYMLHDFRKMMFARHPLERLASVYYSKLSTASYGDKELPKLFGRAILRRFRLNATSDARRTGRNVAFQEIVKYVINMWKNGDELDIYLTPINDICFPCGISYDFIGYLDNFADDTQSVFALLSSTYQQIATLSGYHQRRFNQTTIRDVYESIPKTDILQLSGVYNVDLYMHAYNLGDLLHW